MGLAYPSTISITITITIITTTSNNHDEVMLSINQTKLIISSKISRTCNYQPPSLQTLLQIKEFLSNVMFMSLTVRCFCLVFAFTTELARMESILIPASVLMGFPGNTVNIWWINVLQHRVRMALLA